MTWIARAGRRALRRLLTSPADHEPSSRRAGADPYPVIMVTPRTWIALG